MSRLINIGAYSDMSFVSRRCTNLVGKPLTYLATHSVWHVTLTTSKPGNGIARTLLTVVLGTEYSSGVEYPYAEGYPA